MSTDKNNNASEAQNSIDVLNDKLTDMSVKVENNKKPLIIAIVAVIVVIAGILLWNNHRNNVNAESQAKIGLADVALLQGNDSIALAQYESIADGSGVAANRATLQAAIMLYDNEKYEEAIKRLDNYDPKEAIVGAAAYSLKGDCYVNLEKYPEAVKAFKKAIDQSDENPYYTPYFMMKLARVYRAQGDFKAELNILEELKKDYPEYGLNSDINVEKYLERARIDAEGK